MAEVFFLDTNIFMYAAGAPHEYKDACVKILNDLDLGKFTGIIDTELPQELLYRYSSINLAAKGIQLCRDIFKYPLKILPVAQPDIQLAIDLFETYRPHGLKPRDAIHAAIMQNHGMTKLLSTDKDFNPLTFLTRIDPLAYSQSLP